MIGSPYPAGGSSTRFRVSAGGRVGVGDGRHRRDPPPLRRETAAAGERQQLLVGLDLAGSLSTGVAVAAVGDVDVAGGDPSPRPRECQVQ